MANPRSSDESIHGCCAPRDVGRSRSERIGRHGRLPAQRPQQRRRVAPVAPAFDRCIARRRRIRDECSRRQCPVSRGRLRERLGEAHVQHGDVRRAGSGARHPPDDIARRDALFDERRGRALARIHRAARATHRRPPAHRACEIDEGRVARSEPGGEGIDRLAHARFIEIGAARDIETERGEHGAHVLCIARCARERVLAIVRIADDERETMLRHGHIERRSGRWR